MSLVLLEVTTLLDARYRFPDAKAQDIDEIIAHASRGEECSTLVIHNVSGAVMVLPWRIVRSISCDGEVRWTRQKRNA